MASPTNLTDRITHLRRRKTTRPPAGRRNPGKSGGCERRMATDYFIVLAYVLLGAACFAQFLLIVWMDL
jgi:hypothetical protein